MIREIRRKGNPVLTQTAAEVSSRDEVTGILKDMWIQMTIHNGIGLAAPQLGEPLRVIVVQTKDYKQAFLNPRIVRRFGGTKNSRETCLSVPGQTVTMTRYKRIIVEGRDENWMPIHRKLKGLAAIVVQHEVDHLNGILIG